MKAYVFPGQGCQKPGMGQSLYNEIIDSRALFKKANEILNFVPTCCDIEFLNFCSEK